MEDHKGSIPARAGEPSVSSGHRPKGRVYPRACGGTTGDDHPPVPTEGLSPRVRGNRRNGEGLVGIPGSIPARAGEPFSRPGTC